MRICVECKKNLKNLFWTSKKSKKYCLSCDKKILKNIKVLLLISLIFIGSIIMFVAGLILIIINNSWNNPKIYLPWIFMILIGIIIFLGNISFTIKLFKSEIIKISKKQI